MLNIAYCCDDNYIPYVGVSMISCIENNLNDFNKIIFHIIIDSNVTDESKDKLKRNISKYQNCEVIFYPFNPEGPMPISDYHPIVNAILFIPNLIPVDKLLFLDADTLVLDSLKELFKLDLEDNYCAGVFDVIPPYFKEKIGFSKEDKYYNSGFVLMDLERMRKDSIGGKFLNELSKEYKYPDQDIINIVLKDKIFTLPPKYNFHGYFLEWDSKNVLKVYSMDYEYYYSEEDIKKSKENIICTHFLNLFSDVPWKDETNPMYDEFKKYATKTSFSNDEIFVSSNFPRWKILAHDVVKKFQNPLVVLLVKSYLEKLFKNK